MSNTKWFDRAILHLETVQALREGAIGRDSFWRPMPITEAIAIEERNVAFCLAQIQ